MKVILRPSNTIFGCPLNSDISTADLYNALTLWTLPLNMPDSITIESILGTFVRQTITYKRTYKYDILSTPAKTIETNAHIDHTPLLSQSLLYFGPKNIRKTLALDRNNRVFDISTCFRKSKARNLINIFSR